MDILAVLPIKTVPRWVIIGLMTIGLILVGFIFKFVISWVAPNDSFATLTFVNGEVEVSDGFAGTAASTGPIATRNVRTLLNTGNGTAGLQMPDGSTVIIDSESTIEFMRKNNNDPFQSFAFTLVKGRILVVSEGTNQTPTHILLGGSEIVEVFQSTVGLVAMNEDLVRGRVDCLEGQCLVNGVYLLNPGQNAQIGRKNIVEITDGILAETWIALSKAGGTDLATHMERILLAIRNNVIPTGTQYAANQIVPITGMKLASPTPSLTLTLWLTGTATPTPVNFIFRRVLPSPTSSGSNDLPPTATFTLIWTPTPSRTPTPTLIPSKTPTASQTIPPTFTNTPTQTYTATITPTPTLIPTATITPTPKPTNTPKPSPTPKPTNTPRNPPTNTPTNTVEPSPTPTFTDTPSPTITSLPT